MICNYLCLPEIPASDTKVRDHSEHGLNQWEATLHCNAVSHWLIPYLEWSLQSPHLLTHCGWVTHIGVSKLTIIGSDNGLSPSRRQAILWTNGGILLIRPIGTNFNEILSEIHIFSFNFKKMHFKMSSAKWRPFCLGLNVFCHTDWNRT